MCKIRVELRNGQSFRGIFIMKKLKLLIFCILFGLAAGALADVSIGFGIPSLQIGINLGAFPRLMAVPGYPVYYAPYLNMNYFFYDGLFWVYTDGRWYTSNWYNGPWDYVAPSNVPVFILRLPIRYYRRPPRTFQSWPSDRPPHWGLIWGREWERQRRGWNERRHEPSPHRAPIPLYQRRFPQNRYPRSQSQRRELEQRHYRYRPENPRTRQYYFQERQRQEQQQRQRPQRSQERRQDNRFRNPSDR